MAHLILFTDANFRGSHKHIFDTAAMLSLAGADSQGNNICIANCEFPNGVSSIAILSGNWQFFQGENFTSAFPVVLGPGLYPFVGDFQLLNDNIRSMMAVSDAPTMSGDPLDAHAILFENENFRGAHLHVFQAETDLGSLGFDNKTSAIVVEAGNWSFYSDTQFDGSYPQEPVFGPGIYPWVEDIGIGNDSITSLRPSTSSATISNSVDNEVILFQYAGFFGAHRHVVAPEPNLNASDDNFFNDNVGSLVVLSGAWSFYADWKFHALYGSGSVMPGTYPDLSTLGIDYDDMSSLRPTVPATVTAGDDILGHVILFQKLNFHGPHKHVFNQEENLNASDDNDFNDNVSSLVVLSGNWQFFRNSGFDDDYPDILGPGLYSAVTNANIRDKDMSSLRVVSDAATVTGDPVNAHLILFENAQFRGSHKHVFGPEPNLNASDDNSFNDQTSSIIVLAGTWATFANSNFQGEYRDPTGEPVLIGLGLYPWVPDIQIKDNDLSSLEPTEAAATVAGQAVVGQVILFENANLHGAHKHVTNVEPNLNASDDSSFNDVTSSIAVLQGEWLTYRDANFQRPYDVTLGEGLFPWVESVGIGNDDMSSLTIAGERRQFSGTATIQIASGSVPEPVITDVIMTFLFYADTRELLVENGFSAISVGSLGTIQFDSACKGTFQTDGQISIPDFKITGRSGVFSADATFTVSTGLATSPSGRYTVTGSPATSPADALGDATLVGAGTLNGDDFAVTLAGTFSPA